MENMLAKIRDNKPLVHHITNDVTVNDCANITLYWGGLPVMAYAREEVAEMVQSASALVLNIGTLEQVEAMLIAGKKANELNIPVILDPVGVGATEFRTHSVLQLMEKLDITVIKGNRGEISILAGAEGEVKGVEAIGEYREIVVNARKLARAEKAIVVVSGAEDIVTDGKTVYTVQNGHPLMGEIVGTGCMLASTIGVFCGISDNHLEAALTAVAAYGIAGEEAGKSVKQPASYKIAFLDNVSIITDEYLKGRTKIKKMEESK